MSRTRAERRHNTHKKCAPRLLYKDIMSAVCGQATTPGFIEPHGWAQSNKAAHYDICWANIDPSGERVQCSACAANERNYGHYERTLSHQYRAERAVRRLDAIDIFDYA